MDSTLWIGLAVVALGAALGAFLMFGQHANPRAQTATTSAGTLPVASAVTPGNLSSATGGDQDVRIRWYQRVRSGLVLLLITIGLGTALGAVIGAVALAVNLMLG